MVSMSGGERPYDVIAKAQWGDRHPQRVAVDLAARPAVQHGPLCGKCISHNENNSAIAGTFLCTSGRFR
jgi:hypothetical protein